MLATMARNAMTDAVLALDIGTSAVKALIVDMNGRILGHGSAEHPMQHPRPGYAEQRPEDWWEATVRAVRAALAEAATSVQAIGLTGQMHSTVLLGDRGDALGPAIIWADTRSRAEVDELTAIIGPRRLLEITGSRLATGFQAATVHWLQRHDPDRWRRTRRVMLPKDYLRFRLAGVLATEPSDASSTLLLDIHTRDWSDTILQAIKLDRSYLPEMHPSASMTGNLGPDAAAALGLPDGLPVIAGGADVACGALGAGVVDPDAMLLSISTGAQVVLPSLAPEINFAGNSHTFCAAIDPGQSGAAWYQMGATMAAGLALRWLRDNIFALPLEDGYAQMTKAAEAVPPGAGGLIFLPYLAGERTPHMNPHARGLFLGLTASHGRAHLVRAVMEGVAFALYDAYRALHLDRESVNRAILAGGGARSSLWRQIFADVFGMPIAPLDAVEQSALGAAVLAVAATTASDTANIARSWARYGASVLPDDSVHHQYQELFAIFRSAYEKHQADFEALTSIEADPSGSLRR
jgi:xylulokinase